MGFFDLSIPYHESDRHITDKTTKKSNWLKLVVKAAELGYTGVAYNRVIKGVMAESDRCSTSIFPLSSLLKLAHSLSASVKFHRDLLSVPVSTPFRQYTRLTVVIDSPAQAAAINSGNPVLKSYDIIAVRPMNQNAFEQACLTSEVDMISIDFSEKLPFRLMQSMVKAAIKRGVYFEINYSSLIVDAQVRRQMISNSKLLVDWTGGKNLILSSGASSVSELRGPYDVANLSSLIGLPFEHAKAAVSKNCRSVIGSALRKKHYYKEAIKVEIMPSSGRVNPEESVFGDWLKWDLISSGEGDLLLDDIEKSFSASGSVYSTVKTVGFVSALNSLPTQGLQIKEILVESAPETLGNGKNVFGAEETKVAVPFCGISEALSGPNLQPKEGQTPEKNRHQSPSHQDFEVSTLPNSSVNGSTLVEEEINHVVTTTELISSKELDAGLSASDREFHNLHSKCCLDNCDGQVPLPDRMTNHLSANDADTAHTCHDIADAEISFYSKDALSAVHGEESKMPISYIIGSYAESVSVKKDNIETDRENEKKPSFEVSDMSLNVGFREIKQFQEKIENLATFANEIPNEESHNPTEKENGFLVSEVEPMQEDMTSEPMQKDMMEEQRKLKDQVGMHCQIQSRPVSGRGRVKRMTVHQHFPFTLKRILNSRPFKKKTRKLNTT